MVKKSKIENQLKTLDIQCSCDDIHTFTYEEISFYSSFGECEMCGSHGDIELLFTCPNTNKEKRITLDEW